MLRDYDKLWHSPTIESPTMDYVIMRDFDTTNGDIAWKTGMIGSNDWGLGFDK